MSIVISICEFSDIRTKNLSTSFTPQQEKDLSQILEVLKQTQHSMQLFLSDGTEEDEKKLISYFIDLDRVLIANDLSLGGNDVRTSKNITLGEYINALPVTYLGGLSFNFDLSSIRVYIPRKNEYHIYLKRYLQGFNRDNKSEVIKDYEWYRISFQKQKESNEYKIAYMDFITTEMNSAKPFPEHIFKAQNTLEDLIDRICEQLSIKIPKNVSKEINIHKITYEGKNVINPMADYITGNIKAQLSRSHRQLKINEIKRSINVILQLEGFYKIEGDNVIVETYLYNQERDKIATSRVTIPKNRVKQFDLIPNVQLVSEADTVIKHVIATPEKFDKRALNIRLRTNKGELAQSFSRGETLSIHVAANLPCKIRIIYKDASGMYFFMNKEELEITKYELNKEVELKEHFECSEPYGVEALIAFATTESFEKLKIQQDQYGRDVILDSIDSLVKKSQSSNSVTRIIQITTSLGK
jgi:hypothetical protein